MIRSILSVVAVALACQAGWSQQPDQQPNGSEPGEHGEIRQRLTEYLETFNSHDPAAVGGYWAADGISVAEESGDRTAGREAIQEEFAAFFEENPAARLTGEIANVRLIRPEVAMIEGRTTLFVAEAEPVESAFSAVLVKEDGKWLISSSHERDLPAPATPYDALKELEWLVGTWEDQTEGAQVITTVRWSSNRAFLIRSFVAQFGEDDVLEGTQVIGWDPIEKQIRTWTFNSDGSFGQGTVSKHDDQWILKMWQILGDGRMASATKVMSPGDDGTFTVQTVGETIDGVPAPTSDEAIVVRVVEDAAAASTDSTIEAGTDTPSEAGTDAPSDAGTEKSSDADGTDKSSGEGESP